MDKGFLRIRQDIDTKFEYHREVARLALRDDRSLWDTLQLIGPRKRNIAPWLQQVQAFYGNIHRVTEAMNFRRVPQEELEQGQAMVEAAAALRIRQAYSKGESQSATDQKKRIKKATLGIARYKISLSIPGSVPSRGRLDSPFVADYLGSPVRTQLTDMFINVE